MGVRLSGVRVRLRWLMVAVAIAGVALGVVESVRMGVRAAKYRRMADWFDGMERRCRAIDAMDAGTRAREADLAFDDPYLDNPAWTRRMIPYFGRLEWKYRHAARYPWLPIEPDPPAPD